MRSVDLVLLAGLALGGSAAFAQAGEPVPVEKFDVLRVCACDCVNQYVLHVDWTDISELECQGLRSDGHWMAVEESRYTPDRRAELLFHTREQFSQFMCERRPSL